VLCRYEGTVEHTGTTYDLRGLCTLEYARGRRTGLPFRRFVYHVINVDATTQVLFVDIRGPLRIPLYGAVYVRSLADHCSRTYRRDFTFTPTQVEPPRTQSEGFVMRLPTESTTRVCVDDGTEVFRIDAVSHQDWAYGLAAGYVNSYRFDGSLRGNPIHGTGYGEHIEMS
jgi:hypothetical protein